MKRLLALLTMITLLLPSCQRIEERFDELENRIDELDSTRIASLQLQIDAINTTLPELEQMDAELKKYIKTLQTTAKSLEDKIEETDEDFAELETAIDKAILGKISYEELCEMLQLLYDEKSK